MSSPSIPTIKRLFALSGNQCAFSKCPIPIIEEDSNKVIGKICHIKAQSKKGPRYDENQSNEERHSFANLIFCPIHHDVIDSDIESYTVERLLEMKQNHENNFVSSSKSIEDEIAKVLIENSTITHFESSTVSNNQIGGQVAHNISNFVLTSDSSSQYEKDLQMRRDAHDIKIFQESELVFDEEQLENGLGNLLGGHYYRDNFINSLNEFCNYLEKQKNQYLNQNLSIVTKELLSSFRELKYFLAYNFFDHPPNQQRENIRYCLYPDLCIDRGGSGSPDDMSLYDTHVKNLNSIANKSWESFVKYRQEIKLNLLI